MDHSVIIAQFQSSFGTYCALLGLRFEQQTEVAQTMAFINTTAKSWGISANLLS